MAASSRLMTPEAERHFPARIRIALPPEGLGTQPDLMMAWLDANCGADNWAMTPAGLHGVANDALAPSISSTPRSRAPSSRVGALATASSQSKAAIASVRTCLTRAFLSDRTGRRKQSR